MGELPYLSSMSPGLISTPTADSDHHQMLLNASRSVYYQGREGDGIIDLGLSLRTLQPEACHPSRHLTLEGFGASMEWPQTSNLKPSVKHSNGGYQILTSQECDEETEGVQSKERWAYVKVNMDGVIVGRKICMLDHSGYSSLALQLEDMFGRQSASGLRLFQAESEFCLLYKDKDESWRTAGDVPWKEFVERVKRLRIGRKDESLSYPEL